MEDKNNKKELDELIRLSIKITDKPSAELNNNLKASLYKREADIRRETSVKSISLWYIPMILNFLTFLLLGVLVRLTITNPYLSLLAVGMCCYAIIAGIVLTAVGVKRTNMKEHITVKIEKRGVCV